jgi:hypothetical protein
MTYDLSEARSILSTTAAVMIDHRKAMKDANTELVQELQALDTYAGIRFILDETDGHVDIQVGRAAVTLIYSASDGTHVILSGGAKSPVPIVYNPTEKMFEGVEADKFLVPVPGQPYRKRSAIAAIVNLACEIMRPR